MCCARGYRRHYFSIESLLATEEQLACTFLKDENYIGFLEPNSQTKKVVAGSTLQLQFWIVVNFVRYTSLVNVEFPKQYRKVFRDILTADPSVVDLKTLSRFYYILGEYLIRLNHRESSEIKLILTQTFRRRFRMIMDWALNGATNQIRTLDSSEINVFKTARKSQEALNTWLKQGSTVIEASWMIMSHKKRKITTNDFL